MVVGPNAMRAVPRQMDVRFNRAGGQIPVLCATLLVLVANSNYATLISIEYCMGTCLYKIELCRLGTYTIYKAKLATPDHSLVHSLSILDVPARCSYQRLVNYP